MEIPSKEPTDDDVETQDARDNLLREKSTQDDEATVNIQQETRAITLYRLGDSPPIAMNLLTAFQHGLMTLSSALSTATLVADLSCVPLDSPLRSHLFCTTLFMSGFCTILQTSCGIRLPIFQGPSSSFLVPLLTLKQDPMWRCDAGNGDTGSGSSIHVNGTSNGTASTGVSEEGQHRRIQYMSGALLLASLLEIGLGAFGLLNVLLRFIGPITVSVTITLIGISLTELPVIYGRPSYWMAFGCAAVIMSFILYFKNVGIPLPRFGKKANTQPRQRFYAFQLLPILLGIMFTWAVSAVLTAAGVFSNDEDAVDYLARSDAKIAIISSSPWLQFTYPGQFGLPRYSLALTLGYLVAIITSAMESVGDYYAAQVVCQVPRPPSHAISRGILVEGIGSILSATVGACHATTSYSSNIAVLSITKNTSRMVMYAAGAIIMVISVVGKAGALFTAIPNPVIGGVLIVVVGSLITIGLSSLALVDMTSGRNLIVVGVPLMAGITLPKLLAKHPEIINTGSTEADQVLMVVLGNPMFVGVFLSLLLDNTAPGSLSCRGLPEVKNTPLTPDDLRLAERAYTWPWYRRVAQLCPWLSVCPFLPDRASLTDLKADQTTSGQPSQENEAKNEIV